MRGGEIMGWLALVIALFPFASSAWAADDDIVGTYRLISANRVILATGDTEDSYGKNPIGFMTYGRDGRMMGMIVFSNRPKAESLDKMTDQQRADLFRTMIAYGGTYTFRGNSVEHHIDISWNELWTGTTVIRDIQKEGDGSRRHELSIHHPEQNNNLATAYPSTADLLQLTTCRSGRGQRAGMTTQACMCRLAGRTWWWGPGMRQTLGW